MENKTNKKWFAAIGTDGTRNVVWGLGNSVDSALSDAQSFLVDNDDDVDLEIHEVSDEFARGVMSGDVSW
jgi:hypothetical protein